MLITHKPCRLVSSLCVVSFLQSVIVTLWAQSMIVVMAQDFVSVKLERQGLSVMSVCQEIPGATAANVSNSGGCPPPAAAWLIPLTGPARAASQSRKRPKPLASFKSPSLCRGERVIHQLSSWLLWSPSSSPLMAAATYWNIVRRSVYLARQ